MKKIVLFHRFWESILHQEGATIYYDIAKILRI